MKKTLSILLAVLMVVSVMTIPTVAEEEEPSAYSVNIDNLLEEGVLPEGVSLIYDDTLDLSAIPAETYFTFSFALPPNVDPLRLFLRVSSGTSFDLGSSSVIRPVLGTEFAVYMDDDKTIVFDRFETKTFYIPLPTNEAYSIVACEPYDENDSTPFETIPNHLVPYGGDLWVKVILAPDYDRSDYKFVVNTFTQLSSNHTDEDGNKVFVISNITEEKSVTLFSVQSNQISSIFEWFARIIRLIQNMIASWTSGHTPTTEPTTQPTTEPTTDPSITYYSAVIPGSTSAFTLTPLTSPTHIPEGTEFRFRVTLKSPYVGNLVVRANGNLVTPSGNVYIVPDVQENLNITVAACAVTLPESTSAFTFTAVTTPSSITYGGSFTFTVVKDASYTGYLAVKANGTVISPTSGNSYTITNITGPVDITVSTLSVSLPPSVSGVYAIQSIDDPNLISAGGDFSFTLVKNTNYQGNIIVKANGEVLTPSENTYTVTNITQPITVTVGAYVVWMPESTGDYTITTLTDLNTLEQGSELRFRVDNAPGNTSGIGVIANGTYLEPDETGVYTTIVNGPVRIEANACTVTLTGTGNPAFTIIAVSNPDAIPVGGSFSFQVNFNPGYDGVLIVKANGNTLTPNSQGVYTVYNIRGPVTISIQAVLSQQP